MIKYNFENKNIVVLAAVFLIVLICWVGVDMVNKIKAGGNTSATNTIIVSATQDVYAAPDLALVSLSVITDKKTVQEAMQGNAKDMNDVIAFVKAQGVEEKDIKTTNFYIAPRYEWYDLKTCSSSYCPSSERTLVGYEVTQSLQVKIRDLAKIGDILQGATNAGANQAGDLQFVIENEDALKEQARSQAIDEAKIKAKTLAKELDIKLVKIVNFSESGQYPIYYSTKSAEAYGMGGDAVAPGIQTGQNQISVTVTLTYQVR